MILPCGLTDSLEQLAGLAGAFHLMGYQFIIKVYNLGRARWKKGIGQSMGKGLGASMLCWSSHCQ